MNIIPTNSESKIDQAEIEQVQKDKQEYKLIGTVIRNKSHMLFGYNPVEDEIFEVETHSNDMVQLVPTEKGLVPKSISTGRAQVDTRHIHFESLNWRNAKKRVDKWKAGKIKTLSNLRIITNKLK